MSGAIWKRVADLAPGDRIHVLNPDAVAIILRTLPSTTPVLPHGRKEWEAPKAHAMIIDFQYLDGRRSGLTAYAFQHPDDRVYLA